MDFVKKISKKVSDAAKTAARKSSDVVEITKLKVSISNEEDKIEKVYAQIGRKVFALYETGETVEEELKKHCEQIVTSKDDIKAMKEQILRLKDVKVCPSCTAELEAEVAYCPKCGAKQEIPLVLVESEDGNEGEQDVIIISGEAVNEDESVSEVEEQDKE